MKKIKIKPSNLISYSELPKDAALQPGINCPGFYKWHKINNIWFAHREPTIEEIEQNRFKN